MANTNNHKNQSVVQCCAPHCEREATRVGQQMCEKHYYRMRRNKTLVLKADISPPPKLVERSDGYVLRFAPSHPLVTKGQVRVYEHRAVYYDVNGDGPFGCHWCGATVTWSDMDIDHIDANPSNNCISNLCASCHPCNVRRGFDKMTASHRARSTAKITWRGETLTEGQWAERVGISRQSIRYRLASGWGLERALTEGRGVTGPR